MRDREVVVRRPPRRVLPHPLEHPEERGGDGTGEVVAGVATVCRVSGSQVSLGRVGRQRHSAAIIVGNLDSCGIPQCRITAFAAGRASEAERGGHAVVLLDRPHTCAHHRQELGVISGIAIDSISLKS